MEMYIIPADWILFSSQSHIFGIAFECYTTNFLLFNNFPPLSYFKLYSRKYVGNLSWKYVNWQFCFAWWDFIYVHFKRSILLWLINFKTWCRAWMMLLLTWRRIVNCLQTCHQADHFLISPLPTSRLQEIVWVSCYHCNQNNSDNDVLLPLFLLLGAPVVTTIEPVRHIPVPQFQSRT